MNSKVLVNETIRSGDENVDSYISELEKIVLAYTTDNASRMVGEANRVIGILADDLSQIAEDGEIRKTKLIKAEKNNLMMDRIGKLMTQIDVMSRISKLSVSIGVAAVQKEEHKEDDQKPVITLEPEAEEMDLSQGVPAIERMIGTVKENISKG